jgi:hypothetical protein
VVLPGLLLVAEHAEGHDDDVDVAGRERLLDRRPVRRDVRALEVDHLHLVAARTQALGSGVATR